MSQVLDMHWWRQPTTQRPLPIAPSSYGHDTENGNDSQYGKLPEYKGSGYYLGTGADHWRQVLTTRNVNANATPAMAVITLFHAK